MILTTTVLVPLRAVGRARSWRPARGLLQNIHVVCRRVFCYPHAEYVYRLPDPHVTQQGIRDTGRVYNGTAITFVDPALHSEADQILILGRYHPGGSVQVFYDPRRPWKAVLERRVPVSPETWWLGGLLCGGGGLILMLGLPYNRAVISRWRRWREAALVAVCVLSPLPAAAQIDSASIRQVLATEDRRFAAMVHADTSALASLLAPDLTYTHTDGAQNTRAELLQLLGSGTLRYASIAPEAREVRVVGSSAVVTGRSAMRVEASGQVHAFRIRYLAVYRRGARGWELIAWQSTRLPAE